jgi:hypothetical protein
MWVGALGERQLALPPGKGVSAGPLMATTLISRSARCPGRSTAVACGIGVRAAARIVADLGTQLAVDVGMAGRVAGGERNAVDRCGSDAVVDRRETSVGSSDHARHSFRAGASEGSADMDREHGGRGGSAAGHTTGGCSTLNWIWPTFRDRCSSARARRQWASRTRFRSRSNPARPYICRLIIFMRLTPPSTAPELWARVKPLRTAASSRRRPLTNRCRSG